MDYWYIWFEVFENGKSQGKCKYPRAYKHKSSAVRRAKQMWSENLYIPMTGTFVERLWVVSQTNPWDEQYRFDTRVEAEVFLDRLKQLCDCYGCATVWDAKELVDAETTLSDTHYAWMKDQLKKTTILRGRYEWIVEMPEAVSLI